jgi:hypothetical protein
MSLLDGVRPKPRPKPRKAPSQVLSRVQRGRTEKDKGKTTRDLCRKFFEGKHYWMQDAAGKLTFQASGVAGVAAQGKPVYRIRNTYNYVQAVIEAKTSAATSRVPNYECVPATDDFEAEAGASMAEQVATYLYGQVHVRRHTTSAITSALVAREGFVMPWFDANVGPFRQDQEGKWVGQGEIRLMNLSRDQVMWEPGDDFQDSRWHGIERTRRAEAVKAIPGYNGTLDGDDRDKVTLTEYLERPTRDYPHGRRMFLVDDNVVVDHRLDPGRPGRLGGLVGAVPVP